MQYIFIYLNSGVNSTHADTGVNKLWMSVGEKIIHITSSLLIFLTSNENLFTTKQCVCFSI